MKHTIISWDCSFRNFFHLIDGLLNQEYGRDEFELIYIEQRTMEVADAYNHKLGLKSLWDRYEEVKDKMNIRVVYLGDDPSTPYHLGKCNNEGIELAKGEIISVMDGDMLLPPDFLKKLEDYHSKQPRVVNLFRHLASRPIGVKKEDWAEQVIDFELCLKACPTRNDPIPQRVENKGPLISAQKKYWEAVGGYDLHRIWSTGVSRLGQDVTARLEILTSVESTTLPNAFAVHPYHPEGFNRNAIGSQKLLELQQDLINWSRSNGEPSWEKRMPYTERLYNDNRKFIEDMIYSDYLISSGSEIKKSNHIKEIFESALGRFYSAYKKINNQLVLKSFKKIRK